MLTPKCIKEGCPGEGRLVANDEREALQLAKQGKLRVRCHVCDSWWTLREEEQSAVVENLGESRT